MNTTNTKELVLSPEEKEKILKIYNEGVRFVNTTDNETTFYDECSREKTILISESEASAIAKLISLFRETNKSNACEFTIKELLDVIR